MRDRKLSTAKGNSPVEDEESKESKVMGSMRSVRRAVVRFLCFFVLIAGLGIAGIIPGAESACEDVYAATDDEIMEALEEALMDAWDNYEDKLTLSDVGLGGVVTCDMFEEAYTNTINDNYQYFYLSYQTSYTYSTSNGVKYVRTATFDYNMTKTEAATALKKLDAAVESALAGVDSSWSDLEKVIYFHDYIARLNEYDTSYSNYTMYNAMVDNCSVCQGYALSFRYLLRACGVECELVSSTELNHVWNAVKINGKYYLVDVTYDDPTSPDRLGRVNHKYFLKSKSAFQSDGEHYTTDWECTGGLTTSDFSSTYYDNYFWDDVTTGFEYVNGTWYGLNGTTIYTYSCNGTSFTQKSSVITISSKWKVWGTSSSYWSGCYSALASYEDALYYSTSDAIYMYVPSSGKTTVIYQLDSTYSSQGYIYGMRVLDDGTVEFYLATSPNKGGAIDVYTALMLPYEDTTVDMAECTITLSTTSYTYSGSAKKPTVTVKYNGSKLTSDTDYTLTYSNNTNAGTATVTVTGKGNYTGSVKKTYTINKASQTVTASAASSSIKTGASTTITASGKGTITYSSASTSIATVSSAGKVTGKGVGSVKITVKAAGNSNYKSASTTVTIKVTLATPVISSVKQSSNTVKVTWAKITGASGYYVYRSTSKSGTYSKVKTITSASTVTYSDTSSKTNGKTYYYKVYAYSGSSQSSASSVKSITYMKGTVSSLTNVSSGITVKWSKVSGATGYYVYRKTSSGSYSKVTTIKSGSTVSYTDTAVKSKNGTTYSYYVQPYNSSSTGYYTAKTTVRLTAVSISSVTNSAAKTLTVKYAKNSSATGYEIQYATSSSFSGSKTVTVSKASTLSQKITSLTKGKTYYVRIRAYKTVSGTKYYSAWSSSTSKKVTV